MTDVNGVCVFNAAGRSLRFRAVFPDKPFVDFRAEPDQKINPEISKEIAFARNLKCSACGFVLISPPIGDRKYVSCQGCKKHLYPEDASFCITRTVIRATKAGYKIVDQAKEMGSDVIVGTEDAAKAFIGVFAPMPMMGFEKESPSFQIYRTNEFLTY